MTGPVDLVAVQQDDLLLDRLGQGLGLRRDDDDVAALLAVWRADLADDDLALGDPDPVPALPPIEQQRPGTRRRVTRSLAVGLVFAGAVASAGGVAAAAAQAMPGSALWPLTKVVAPEHAESAQARHNVEKALNTARRNVTSGQLSAAERKLAEARRQINQVAPQDGRAALSKKLDQLSASANSATGSTAAPTPSASSTESVAPSPSPTADGSSASPAVSTSPAASPGGAHLKKAAGPHHKARS